MVAGWSTPKTFARIARARRKHSLTSAAASRETNDGEEGMQVNHRTERRPRQPWEWFCNRLSRVPSCSLVGFELKHDSCLWNSGTKEIKLMFIIMILKYHPKRHVGSTRYRVHYHEPNPQPRYSQRFFRLLQSSLDHAQVVFSSRRYGVFFAKGCPRNS